MKTTLKRILRGLTFLVIFFASAICIGCIVAHILHWAIGWSVGDAGEWMVYGTVIDFILGVSYLLGVFTEKTVEHS